MATKITGVTSRRLRACSSPLSRRRAFSVSSRCLMNPLLNLSHFSASKEAQYLSRERKIPRTEFAPHLELIRSSEVDIFAPAPGASPTVIAELKRAEMGQTDMQTTYSLAIFNLGQQVQIARQEAMQAHATLAKIHDKYRREERNSFVVMLTTIALLSLILVKTDAIQELKEYAKEVTSQWKGFDWEWLGNPPSYRSPPSQPASRTSTKSEQPLFVISTPNGSPILPMEAVSDQQARREKTTQPEPVSSPQPWTLSRLFWAAPTNARAET